MAGSSIRNRGAWAVIGIGVLALIVWLVSYTFSGSPSPSGNVTGGPMSSQGALRPSVAGMDQSSIEDLAARASRGGAPGENALRDAVADTLLVYSGGTADDFLALLESYGVDAPPSATTNPRLMESGWRRTRSFFNAAGLRMDGAEIAMNPPARELTELQKKGIGEPGDVGRITATARRDHARDFLRDQQAHTVDRVRVSIPGSFRLLGPTGEVSASRTEGTITFEWTYDPGSERWVLTELDFDGRKEDPSESTNVPLML